MKKAQQSEASQSASAAPASSASQPVVSNSASVGVDSLPSPESVSVRERTKSMNEQAEVSSNRSSVNCVAVFKITNFT